QHPAFAASGTVTYSLFHNSTCALPAFSTQPVAVSATGAVANANSTGTLAKGSYAFRAGYSGDINYSASTSSCEPFSVALAPTTTATSVIDNLTGLAWTGLEQAGASAHDTATVGGQQSGIAAGGTATYSFFHNGSCVAPAATTQ